MTLLLIQAISACLLVATDPQTLVLLAQAATKCSGLPVSHLTHKSSFSFMGGTPPFNQKRKFMANVQGKVDNDSVASTAASDSKEAKKVNLKYMRDKDREVVRGIFRFYECPGGTMSFSIKIYKEDEVETYTLIDGEVYSLPLGVAKHLNKNGWYPVHSYTQDASGKPVQKIGQKVQRFGLQSLEFVDIEDLTQHGSRLITVENIIG
jgi:hypothetical protein